MRFITIETARVHCKTDGTDDDAQLEICVDGAEAACVREVNRDVFVDATAQSVAMTALPGIMATARTAYDAAIIAADALTDSNARDFAIELAESELTKAKVAASKTMKGIVAEPNFVSAVLLTLGHLYANREDVVAGQGAAAVELPNASRALLAPLRWVGSL